MTPGCGGRRPRWSSPWPARLRRVFLLISVGVVAWGCTRGTAPLVSESVPRQELMRSPERARWQFQPRNLSALRAEVRLSDGRVVQVDSTGNRWMQDEGGELVPAGSSAAERLVGGFPIDGQLAFIGNSGAVYLSRAPLEPFHEIRKPQEVFVSAATLSKLRGIVVVDRRGGLQYSSDLGRTFQAERLDGFVAAVFPVDEGEVLVQAMPETWYRYRGPGTLERLTDTFGVERVESTPRGLVVHSLLGAFQYRAGRFGEYLPVREGLELLRPARSLSVDDLARAPERSALEARFGRGVWIDPQEGQVWLSEWGAPLEPSALQIPSECGVRRVVHTGTHIALLCEVGGGAGSLWSLFAARLADKEFTLILGGIRGHESIVRFVGFDSTVALAGVCSPLENDRGCAAKGLYALSLFAPLGASSSLDALEVPSPELASALAFSGDGALWGAVTRPRDQHLFVFRISPRALHERKLDTRSSKERISSVDLHELLGSDGAPGGKVELLADSSLTMGAVLEVVGQRIALALDERLRLLGFGELPSSTVRVSGSGEHFFAIEPKTQVAWESSSAGIQWGPARLPSELCSLKSKRCDPDVYCVGAGCLVSEGLVRSGWGEPETGFERSPPSFDTSPEVHSSTGSPILCRARPEPAVALEGLASLPNASDAARGDVLWSQVGFDQRAASAWVYHAPFGRAQIEKRMLFQPALDPRAFALAVSEQVEGSAAVRFRLPNRKFGETQVSQLEVAWDNRLDGTMGHRLLAGSFGIGSGNYRLIPESAAEATPALVSISGDGVYLSFHGARTEQPKTLRVTARGKGFEEIQVARLPEPLRQVLTKPELIRTGEVDTALTMNPQASLVSIKPLVGETELVGQGVSLDPYFHGGRSRLLRLANFPPQRSVHFVVGIAYRGQEPGLVTLYADATTAVWRGFVLPLDLRVPEPRRVPTMSDLSTLLRACTANERKRTDRVVSPMALERREVRVESDWASPLLFEVARGVVQGDLADPCVAALDAVELEPESGAQRVVLVDLVPGAPSWLLVARGGETHASLLDCRVEGTTFEAVSSAPN